MSAWGYCSSWSGACASAWLAHTPNIPRRSSSATVRRTLGIGTLRASSTPARAGCQRTTGRRPRGPSAGLRSGLETGPEEGVRRIAHEQLQDRLPRGGSCGGIAALFRRHDEVVLAGPVAGQALSELGLGRGVVLLC